MWPRLQGMAKPGEIIISDRVHALLDDAHEVEHSGLTELKGQQETIDVYRLGSMKLDGNWQSNPTT